MITFIISCSEAPKAASQQFPQPRHGLFELLNNYCLAKRTLKWLMMVQREWQQLEGRATTDNKV